MSTDAFFNILTAKIYFVLSSCDQLHIQTDVHLETQILYVYTWLFAKFLHHSTYEAAMQIQYNLFLMLSCYVCKDGPWEKIVNDNKKMNLSSYVWV